MLFLTVREVAAGGWSKEVYEVRARLQVIAGSAKRYTASRGVACSPADRAAPEPLHFCDKVPGSQATKGPLKVAQTAAVLEVGSLPALWAAEWLRAR